MTTLITQVLATVGGVALYLLARRWNQSRNSGLSLVPTVETASHWLLGHERQAWETPDAKFYVDNFDKYGQAFVMKGAFFHPDILAISDPAALVHMHSKKPYSYSKSAVFRPLIERLMGKTLAWAEGDEHKRQRAALAPVFTHDNVKTMDAEVRISSDRLAEAVREHIHKSRSVSTKEKDKGSVYFNPMGFTSSATLDVIGAVGFGYDFQFGASAAAVSIQKSWSQLTAAGMTLSGGLIGPLVIRAFPFITDLPVEAIQAQGEIRTIIRGLGRKIVDERRAAEEGGELRGKDLLSGLLRLQDSEVRDVDAILDHISTFCIAGFETTAASLNYALYNLAHNIPMQDRLRHELRDFVSSGETGEPTYDELISKLPVLDAVVKETLRLYGSISHTERVALEDDVLPLRFPIKNQKTGEETTYIPIKKGQVIHISHLAVNRVRAVWGPDSDEFKPERWLAAVPGFDISSLDLKGVSPLPLASSLSNGWNGLDMFLEGPRVCIGMRLALFEMKVMLSTLIKAFEFLPVEGPDGKIETMFSCTLQPFIAGRLDEGVKIPLRVRETRA
ncbi:hypothetical protein FRB94_013569 [Tulasnella sp. JGI-2019a]|nr:hypothetical protein FRB94_013569 [Tulasnella sp. JGI-2019a]